VPQPIPEQARLVRGNLRDLFLEEKKPIRKLRVLALNERSVSWVEDAKNCARIYSRMLLSRAICPRILPLTAIWAQFLLDYSSAYGFGENIQLIKRTPTVFQTNEWLRRLLIEIRDMDHADKIYGRMVTRFGPDVTDLGRVVGVTDPLCGITHLPMKNFESATWWITELENGKKIYSKPTGTDVFKWVEKMIKQGLKRHRRMGYCQALDKRIRVRNRRNG